MFRLTLLGGVSIEGPEGLLSGRVVQRRQLALLALLAGSRVDPLSRDRVIAVLWPDIPSSRARHRLSDTLHVLRKSLGEAAVFVAGDDLALDPEMVWSDVRAFRQHLEDEERAEALGLYAGPFLEGFHADGTGGFERWGDRERQRLRGEARRAAGELTEAAARDGDHREAARWARRALAIDPYDEGAVRTLVRLLARTGDRAAALRAYEGFVDRFRADLELEPSAETEALVRDIRDGEGPGPAAPTRTDDAVRSLAVLPLDDLTADASGEDYFAAGMHDALIGELARTEALRVISRTSAAAFGDTDRTIPEIADELDVDAVLEGSVLRTDGRVRIQLQLLRARPEERHLWSETYDREIEDVLALHRQVARAVAREIRVRLSPGTEERLARARRVNPAMYDAYLRGVFHLNKFTPEGFRRGLEYLQQAVEEDPADPLPHAALALGYSQYGHESGEPGVMFPRAKAAAERALEVDDTLAEAHEALAETRLYWEWDWEGAERTFERVLEINPNLPLAHAHRGWYLQLRRRWDEGIAAMLRACRLDPLVPLFPAWAGWQLRYMGRLEEAIEQARASLELQKDFPVGLYVLGSAHAAAGRWEEAIQHQRVAAEVSPEWAWGLGHTLALAGRDDRAREVGARMKEDPGPMTSFGLAVIHAALGDVDEAFRWLDDAFEARFSWIPWMAVYPTLSPLHDDPRYGELMRRLDLPEPWTPADGGVGEATGQLIC